MAVLYSNNPIIRRHFTADSINEVVNDPSVYPWVRGVAREYLDLTPALANTNHVLLMGEYGGMFFQHHQPGLYEVHTQVLPAGRGKWMKNVAGQCFNWMFSKTDAVEITTRIPKGNLGARSLAMAMGLTQEFRNEKGWVINDKVVYADIMAIKIQDWIKKAPNLKFRGEWFHEKLEKEYKKLGKTTPPHPEDAVHNQNVGYTVETIMGGQPHKAATFYNRWACMAGYLPISVLTEDPIVIDINEALLMFNHDDFWVMSCR